MSAQKTSRECAEGAQIAGALQAHGAWVGAGVTLLDSYARTERMRWYISSLDVRPTCEDCGASVTGM